MIPYFGVLPPCFNDLNNAFSAPKIWIVEAAALDKFTKDPACEMSFAATLSPTRV